jgi:predicted RNA-binding protein YlqC (UPF0109 family)
MPDSDSHPPTKANTPDYAGLVEFLVKPFLEQPESLRVNCEVSTGKAKVWVRLAFEGSDKGRVFGRGGRNIQAIRAVLEAAAKTAGYSAYLDIYGGAPAPGREDGEAEEERKPHRRPVKQPPKARSR